MLDFKRICKELRTWVNSQVKRCNFECSLEFIEARYKSTKEFFNEQGITDNWDIMKILRLVQVSQDKSFNPYKKVEKDNEALQEVKHKKQSIKKAKQKKQRRRKL